MRELEAQVMNIRGLDALQEVPRYVTNRTRFTELMNADESTAGTDLELRKMEWAYKALGLLKPQFDLVDYNNKVGAVGAAAVYVPWRKTIFVFGTQFSGAERFFYVHEYDHALVDQHYQIADMGVYPICKWDTQHCMAISSLVEGDATLLEYLWFYKYASIDEYRDLYYYVPPSSLSPGQEPPPAFALEFNFPYEQGYEFVLYLYERGGWNSINRAYKNLPSSTEQIIHPEKFIAGERPITVKDPAFDQTLGEGWIQTTSDSLGEWETYLILGYGAEPTAQLDDKTAKEAARGWGGDHYQVYHNLDTGGTVLTAHWIWDAQSAATRFNKAFNSYQSRRFNASEVALSKGKCWEANGQTSCTLTSGRETLWLLTPNQALMNSLFGLYPNFR
jgi:hypothetical protein